MRIENELPSSGFVISDDGDEETVYIEETEGIEVVTIEVVIDEALSEFQKDKVLPKKRKGTYSLSGAFETVFGPDSELAELAIDLETALSGYQDMIYMDDIDLARSLIDALTKEIEDVSSKG